jgi:hypothetical protein
VIEDSTTENSLALSAKNEANFSAQPIFQRVLDQAVTDALKPIGWPTGQCVQGIDRCEHRAS